MTLSYVVRSQTDPDRTTDFQDDFISQTTAIAPLSGANFQADTREVHKLMKNYLVSETAEQWIISIDNRMNGRDNFDTSVAITAVINQPPCRNIRFPLRDTALQERVCVFLQYDTIYDA